ncbi:5-(carboxyamino)imidazole ribonucleotide synthase [Sphingomonas sp. URHD0057]|uniref:5-(carboxyamino)imidazole ribonucleotide synthase n=1 Tax=Sphingomonas sp. URHD0057 TaxID=1380389 RepID=UPI0004900264|nr:5-(carboxyamino)imidazole ribonucleotide synthase [Sphingomonas sp. URHD0057]
MTIPPGSTIGILGGGQLGRMLSIAAARLGYKCHIFDPHESPCAADVAAAHTRAAFDDVAALERFASEVDVVTYEFENVPVGPLEAIADKLLPSTRSLAIAQDRASEKEFLERCGARVAPWRAVLTLTDVACAASELGMPIVLKTRRYGYDGKGQAWIASGDVTEQSWQAIGAQPAVAESGISFESEFSVIIARWADGLHAVWDPAENEHGEGILRRSTVPTSDAVAVQLPEACEVAVRIAEALDHVGVLTVEFFASEDGPLVNEIAPRVHNSGHWTIEGAVTSQFEQHIRAICGLPRGTTDLIGAGATMDNLIGDDVDRWPELVADPGAHVHIYGKDEARPGRKMGHVTRLR